MSYVIEYNRKIYEDKGKDGKGEDLLMLVRQGDNNVYDMNGQRDKSWDLRKYGWEYQLWEEIGMRGGACEGGGLQRGVGFGVVSMTIEKYVEIYREAIKNRKPIDEMFKDFDITFHLEMKKKIKDEWDKEKVKEIMKKYKFIDDGTQYYHKNIKCYSRPITKLSELRDCLEVPKGNYASDFYSWFHFTPIPDWRKKYEKEL